MSLVQKAIHSAGTEEAVVQSAAVPGLRKQDASLHEERDYGPVQMLGVSDM